MKVIITLLFLFFSTILFSQTKYDTIIRKKYLDSLKNQLALHTTGYYTYLNLYDRSENDRRKINISLQATQRRLESVEDAWKRQNILHGLFFGFISIMSMVMIIIFN